MHEPPSCSMAASKESRVRVEAFSKIIVSVRPAMVLTMRRSRRARLSTAARRNRPRCSSSVRSVNLRKSRFFDVTVGSLGAAAKR